MLHWSVARSSIALTLATALFAVLLVLALGGGPAAALAWLVPLVVVMRVLPVLASFGIALRRRGAAQPPRLGAKRLLRLLAAEAWATVRLFFFYHPLAPLLLRDDGETARPGCTPVVLVHGFYSNSGFWQVLRRALRGAGWHNLYALDLHPLDADIDAHARQLEARIDAVCRRCQADAVIVVAHSMGGLVARACARRCSQHIRHIVCLGSPHHGTRLADTVPSISTRQMRCASGWLGELNASDSDVPISNLYSTHDNIIVPQDSATLPDARNIALDAIGHLEMGFSPLLRQTLLDEMERLRGHASA